MSAPPYPQPASGPSFSLGAWRGRLKWSCGVLLAVDILALFIILSLMQITAAGPAQRALEHSVAILTEVDAYLDTNYEDIRDEASTTEAPNVDLPGFPVPVSIAPEEVLDGDEESLRTLLLERSASVIHSSGVSAIRDGDSDISFFSTQGAIRTGMDFLRPTPHRVLTYVTIILSASAGVLAAGLLLAARGYGKAAGLGFAVFAVTVPLLTAAIAARFALRVAADGADDILTKEFLELGQELTWAPIRNGIIFAVGSVTLAIVGMALARWDDLRPRDA